MSSHPCLLRAPAGGFTDGISPLTRLGDAFPSAPISLGLEFTLATLRAGEHIEETHALESAWVLLSGEADVEFASERVRVKRTNLFDELPTAVHLGPSTRFSLRVVSPRSEWAVVRTENTRAFAPRLFLPKDLQNEYRGAGLVQNACLREVKLIFDRTTRPEPNLVLGEVVNYPGRWSSYPPHHHDQPEVYHYRFTHDSGYGHAELGDDVVKVRHGDTTLIPPGLDHAQVSAPGYGMYYLWMIRHLPGNPYTGFTFTEEHKWTLDPAQQGWQSKNTPNSLT